MSRGVLAVVSGFSGAGKGTIMKSLMAKYDNYALSVSATTRNPTDRIGLSKDTISPPSSGIRFRPSIRTKYTTPNSTMVSGCSRNR